MRITLFIIILLSFTTVKSQTISTFNAPVYFGVSFLNNSHGSLSKSKWSLSSFKGISTGVSFFNGGSATFLALPLGIQLSRRLNNNLYTFANVAVAPAFISLNPSLIAAGNYKKYSANPFIPNSFNVYPSASLGLMYVNDARTFSISGSISAERSSYPILPYYQGNKTPVIIHSER